MINECARECLRMNELIYCVQHGWLVCVFVRLGMFLVSFMPSHYPFDSPSFTFDFTRFNSNLFRRRCRKSENIWTILQLNSVSLPSRILLKRIFSYCLRVFSNINLSTEMKTLKIYTSGHLHINIATHPDFFAYRERYRSINQNKIAIYPELFCINYGVTIHFILLVPLSCEFELNVTWRQRRNKLSTLLTKICELISLVFHVVTTQHFR